MGEYRQCTRCVLDTSVSDIIFDDNGVCNYCHDYVRVMSEAPQGKAAENEFKRLIDEIKKTGKNKEYNCILGVSGGVDSTYLAYLAAENGLKPLIVHVDTGWNSEIAVKNIENMVKKLGLDLYTEVVNWNEMRDLQLAFFKASVPDCDIPQDHVFPAILHKLARKYGIKSILSGHNNVTEYVYPKGWGYDSNDLGHLLDIHKKHGTVRLKKYPQFSYFQKALDRYVLGIKSYRLLNYVHYNKAQVKNHIANELGWRDYGGKHYESRFTKFFQAYYLPEKFNIDKRKMHLSNLIVSNQITRDEALSELSKPLFYPVELEQELDYVTRKLGISIDEWKKIMHLSCNSHSCYRRNCDKVFYRLYYLLKKKKQSYPPPYNIWFRIIAFVCRLITKLTGFFQMSIWLSTIPFNIGNKIRYFYYKKMLNNVGDNVLFSYGVIVSYRDISIGSNVRFGPYCTIGLVDFGDNVLVAQSVHFLSGRHQHGVERNNMPMGIQTGQRARIKIFSDVWIGAQSVIMTDIPTGCVLGAGSVAVKNIEKKYAIYAGNPAKFIKEKL